MNDISVVISYCSLENKFIDKIINECKIFSNDIIIVRGNKLLDGSLDINARKFKGDGIQTIILDIDIIEDTPRNFHNKFRYKGWEFVKNDYVLFLDADEVPNGNMFKEFLESFKYTNFNAMSFNAHWYFRDTTNQATTSEETVALFKTSSLVKSDFFGIHERWSMFNMPKTLRRFNPPMFNEPMFHHYSWVRTKEEMLKKVASWGHNKDRNWAILVEQEFEHDFNGTDFVHGYSYKKVNSFI